MIDLISIYILFNLGSHHINSFTTKRRIYSQCFQSLAMYFLYNGATIKPFRLSRNLKAMFQRFQIMHIAVL